MAKLLKGTQDILPKDIRVWNFIEDTSRRIFERYCYDEIRTPIIEETGLFIRSVGEDTDIVKKQMYSFNDQGGRNICLRPEETASVARAYIEHHLDKKEGFVKLFYVGPMFRGERPQAGRYRQFHQVGVEAIGSYSHYLDAEVIILLNDLLKSYGLADYTFKLNSLGCEKDKDKLKDILRNNLKPYLNKLCDDCQRRYKTNILRVLDCKSKQCKAVIRTLPLLTDYLCADCADNFRSVNEIIDDAGIAYEVSPFLVRGLDYYTKTVYEVTTKSLGAQDAVAAGGRYDNLISDFGGPKTGACGFAIGVERVIEALSKIAEPKMLEKKEAIFIATVGYEAYREGFKILADLRNKGLPSEIDYQNRSLKAQMRYADKLGARYVIILGEDELKEGQATVKNMLDGSQEKVPLTELYNKLKM